MKKIVLFLVFSIAFSIKAQAQTNADTLIIKINPIPTKPNVTTNKDTVLLGWSATLSATACASPSTVVWLTPSAATGIPRIVSPTVNTTYKALCRSNKGCEGLPDSVSVKVRIPNPIQIKYNNTYLKDSVSFCLGDSTALSINDAICNSSTITWSDGTVGPTLKVKPTIPGLYTYTYNCTIVASNEVSTSSLSVKIRVHPTPNVPILTPSVSTKLTTESATIVGNNCIGTIYWSTGQTTNNGQPITVAPTVTTTYTAYCQSIYGCVSPNGSTTITVIAPVPTVTASAGEVCLGESIVLTGTGCTLSGVYVWSNGSDNPSLTIGGNGVPYSDNTVYWVLCRNISGDSQKKYIKVKYQ
jgi:large repetitive protein